MGSIEPKSSKQNELSTSMVPLDISNAGPPRKTRKPFSFHMSILTLCLLALISSWDATALSVALPAIASQLHGTTLQSFWASISFILGVAISQPIYVSVSDVFGRKQPLYVSMVLFAVGAIIFATAHTMVVLIIGRLIQGLGAGGLDVLEEIILADITSLKERPLYLGIISIPIVIGSVLGPIVGALFTEFVDWRWIGWINLPIVGTAFVLAVLFLNIRPLQTSLSIKIRQLDWIGIVLYTIGATSTALPLSWAGSLYSWSSWKTILPLVIGIAVLIVFGLYEKRPANALFPYRVFSNTTTVASLITGFIHGLVLYTILLYLPLFFQAVFLKTPLKAAISFLPVCILTVTFSVVAPVTIELTRRYRVLLWAGWLFIAVFMGLFCLVGHATSRAETYVLQALLGIGVGIVFTGTQIPVQASVEHVDDTGLAVGMLVVFRLTGALVGLSVSSTAFSSVFATSIAAFRPLPEQLQVLEDANQAIGFIPVLRTLDLPVETLVPVLGAYTKAFHTVWIIIASLAALGFCISLLIQEFTLETEDVGRQGFETSS